MVGRTVRIYHLYKHIREFANLFSTCGIVCLSNFITLLICFLFLWQVVLDPDSGASTDELTKQAITCLKDWGVEVTKASEISPKVPDALDQAIKAGIGKANAHAVSNAAKVRTSLCCLFYISRFSTLAPVA